MLGSLPKTLNINGTDYAIRSDYRNILQIISAYNDSALTDAEKAFICMKRLFTAFDTLPQSDYDEAYRAAVSFIDCGERSGKTSPRVINWEKDEQMIFAAVNKVAGAEIRGLSYLHWWTFLGYFQNIDREDIWGFVLMIRQKCAKRKKLEKHEQEFFNANRDLCLLEAAPTRKTLQNDLDNLFQQLSEGRE